MSHANVPVGAVEDQSQPMAPGRYDGSAQNPSPPVHSSTSSTSSTSSLPKVCGEAEYFFAEDPSKSFTLKTTKAPIHEHDANDGWYCLVTKSLQMLPRQCRGVAFIYKHEIGSWKLGFIFKYTRRVDQLTYVHVLANGSTSQKFDVPKASYFFQSHQVRFVNIHAANTNGLVLEYPVAPTSDGFLEVRISPTRLHFRNDSSYRVVPDKRRKRNKGRSKSHKRLKATSTSGEVFVTIFVRKNRMRNSGIDSVQKVNKNDLVVPLPEPEAGGPHHVCIHKGVFNLTRRLHFVIPSTMIPRELNNRTVAEVASRLREDNKLQRISLMEIKCQRAVRFSIVSDKEFKALKAKEPEKFFIAGSNEYVFREDNRSTLQVEGTVVSWWSQQKGLHGLSRNHLRQVQIAVGQGFGPRISSFCIGINAYFGERCSHRPKPTPFILSKENIALQDFQRQSWCAGVLLPSRLEIEAAAAQVQQISEHLNPFYTTFTGNSVCNKRNIYTAGLMTGEGLGAASTNCPIGFSNFPHEDRGDYMHSQAVDFFKNRLLCKMRQKKYSSVDRTTAMAKLHEVATITGNLGIPTTVGHQIFKGEVSHQLSEVHATFGMFDFALPIRDGMVHHFYGWAFRHVTLVPFWLSQEGERTVHFCNDGRQDDDDIIIVAFGRTGGKIESRKEATGSAKSQH